MRINRGRKNNHKLLKVKNATKNLFTFLVCDSLSVTGTLISTNFM